MIYDNSVVLKQFCNGRPFPAYYYNNRPTVLEVRPKRGFRRAAARNTHAFPLRNAGVNKRCPAPPIKELVKRKRQGSGLSAADGGRAAQRPQRDNEKGAGFSRSFLFCLLRKYLAQVNETAIRDVDPRHVCMRLGLM